MLPAGAGSSTVAIRTTAPSCPASKSQLRISSAPGKGTAPDEHCGLHRPQPAHGEVALDLVSDPPGGFALVCARNGSVLRQPTAVLVVDVDSMATEAVTGGSRSDGECHGQDHIDQRKREPRHDGEPRPSLASVYVCIHEKGLPHRASCCLVNRRLGG